MTPEQAYSEVVFALFQKRNEPTVVPPFFITGTCAYGLKGVIPSDIDFVIRAQDWPSIRDRFPWEESDYFPESGFKLTLNGQTYNAVVVPGLPEYFSWEFATNVLSDPDFPGRDQLRDKTTRVNAFELLKTTFAGFFTSLS